MEKYHFEEDSAEAATIDVVDTTNARDEDVESIQTLQADNGDYYFICGNCRQWFATKSSLILHIAEHFQYCPACEICGEEFTDASDYADHCSKHVGYTCMACAETFFSASAFAEHFMVHKLNCIFCKVSFPTEDDLQNHYAEHTESVNHKCDLCHNFYSSLRSLSYHKRKQHKSKSKLFECSICHEMFSESGSRNRHYRVIHKKIKDFVCNICGKEYTCKNSLITHLSNHAGLKPHCCLVCGRSYADKKQFKVHGKEHLASKSDPCNVCGKVFASDRRLKTHTLIHTNAGAYRCDICARAFSYSSHLKCHIMAHYDERPQKCEVCGRGFIQKCKLKNHLKAKHAYDDEALKKVMTRLKLGIVLPLY